MPLISHSPENQLMNSTGLVFGEALRAALGSPPAPCPHCPPSPPHPHPTLLHMGLRLGDKAGPSASSAGGGGDVITGGLAPHAGEAIIVENCIDFGQRQERNLQSRETARCVIFVFPYKFRAQS